MKKDFISVQKASALLGVSTATLYRWHKQGKIEIVKPEPAKIPMSQVEKIASARAGDGVAQ